MAEYQSRDFCRAINCPLQTAIEKGKGDDVVFAQKFCENDCNVWLFEKWLRMNGYKIVKGDD